MSHFGDRLVLITGGDSGIGYGIAEALVERGALVCIAGRDENKLEKAQDRLLQRFPDAEVVTHLFDVTDRDAVHAAIESLESTVGPIYGLVNGAGLYRPARFLEYEPADFEAMFRVNVIGVVHMMQAILPRMRARHGGRVLNIASTAGKWGSLNQSAYNTSKHALVGLTRCAALEFAPDNITVNAICPGIVHTDMGDALLAYNARLRGVSKEAMLDTLHDRIPLRRIPEPAEIGELAADLLSPTLVGITGQSILYDGGMLMV